MDDVVPYLSVVLVFQVARSFPTFDRFIADGMNEPTADMHVEDDTRTHIVNRTFAVVSWLQASVHELEAGLGQYFVSLDMVDVGDSHFALLQRTE